MNSNFGDLLVKPLLVAGIGAGISSFQYPDTIMSIYGTDYSLAKVTFAAVFAGSVVAELLHEFVFPHIPKMDKLSNMNTEIVAVGAVYGTNVLLHYIANAKSLQEIGLGVLFIESAAAEVAGDYLYRNFASGIIAQMGF